MVAAKRPQFKISGGRAHSLNCVVVQTWPLWIQSGQKCFIFPDWSPSGPFFAITVNLHSCSRLRLSFGSPVNQIAGGAAARPFQTGVGGPGASGEFDCTSLEFCIENPVWFGQRGTLNFILGASWLNVSNNLLARGLPNENKWHRLTANPFENGAFGM